MIDFHTHIFPTELAQRAIPILSKTAGNIINYTNGTENGLISSMNKNGVLYSVVLNIATNGNQMQKVNDFAIETNKNDRFIAFGSVYPKTDNAIEELHRLYENGIKGIKLHPEYQDFFVDDDKYYKLYETISKLGLITVFHAGHDLGYKNSDRAAPVRFKNILKAFTSPVVFAHFGGYDSWDEVLDNLAGENCYFDTSFCFGRIPLPMAKEIVKIHGADKILFGTDSPWSCIEHELRLIDALELKEEDRQAVLHGNAEKMLF